MKSKREQILKLCEFDEKKAHDELTKISMGIRWRGEHSRDNILGRKAENIRLQPIITALLDRVEQLEEKVDKSYDLIWNQILLFSHNQDSMLIINSEKINKLFVLKDELKQTIATSPLDEILNNNKGE